MKKENKYINIKIRKRPWYNWLLWIIWLAWLIFWAEIFIGSRKELEVRAYYISLTIFILSLIIGFLIWLWNTKKHK